MHRFTWRFASISSSRINTTPEISPGLNVGYKVCTVLLTEAVYEPYMHRAWYCTSIVHEAVQPLHERRARRTERSPLPKRVDPSPSGAAILTISRGNLNTQYTVFLLEMGLGNGFSSLPSGSTGTGKRPCLT